MDKAQAKTLQSEIGEALKPIYAKHGLRVTSSRSRYDTGEFNITIKAEATDPAFDPKVQDWDRYAESYGLPKDARGQTVVVGGVIYRVEGLVLSRRRFPVAVTRLQDSKAFLLTAEAIRGAWGTRKVVEA